MNFWLQQLEAAGSLGLDWAGLNLDPGPCDAGRPVVRSIAEPSNHVPGWMGSRHLLFSTLSLNDPYDGPNAPGCSASIILHLARVIRSSQVVYDLSSGLISNPPFVIRQHGRQANSPQSVRKYFVPLITT